MKPGAAGDEEARGHVRSSSVDDGPRRRSLRRGLDWSRADRTGRSSPQSALHRWVIPGHAQLVGRVVVAVDEVGDRHVGEGREAVGHAGRDEDASVIVGPVGLCAEIEAQRGAVGGRAVAEVVEDDAGRPERHVPVVRLVEVVVEADDAARLSGRPDCPESSRGPGGTTPAGTSPRNPPSSPWVVGVTTYTPAMVSDSRWPCRSRLGPSGSPPRYSTSTLEWSPSMRRMPWGAASDRMTSTSLPMSESVDAADADDAAALEHDRVLELGVDDLAAVGDRGERPDVAVTQPGAGSDDRRPQDLERVISAPSSMTTRPSIVDASSTRPRIAGSRSSRIRRLLSSSGSFLPVSSHQPSRTSWRRRAPVEEPLDGVGDLELAPGRGLDRADGLVDGGVEQVDADQGEVRRRVGRLLHQADDLARPRRSRPRRTGGGLGRGTAGSGPRGVVSPGQGGSAAAWRAGAKLSDELVRAPAGACCRPGT